MKSNKSNIGSWILFVFGLIFFLVGIGVAVATIGTMTVTYFSSTNWQQVPVNITSIKLKESRGDNSSTYRVEATYSYSYNGNRQSSDVALSNASDNIGDYWQELYKQLKQDQAANRAQAWVNPSNPDEALLDRTFRWAQVAVGLLFFLMFGGFGFGAMWLSMKSFKPIEKERQEARDNGISSNEKSGFWILFLFGCPFLLIGLLTFFLSLPNIINKGEYEALLTLLFVFAGGGIMSFAYINQRRYKLIGPSPLFLDPLPGVIGGQVGGKFNIAARSQNTPVKVVLTCKKRIRRRKNTTTKILWQESMQGYVQQSHDGLSVSFLFDCPEHLPDSNSSSIFWEVRAQSDLKVQSKTVKFERNWNIPVENTEAVASSINIPEQFTQQQDQLKTQQAQADASDLINFNQQGRFLNVESVGERPIGSFFGGVLFGLIFSGAGIFTITQDWWPGYIFVVIGTIIICASIFVLGRDIDIKIDIAARILYTRRRWFNITLYKREVMLFDPTQFSMKKTSSTTTNNSELTEWYKVQVKNQDKQVLIAEGVKGKEVAQALMDNIIKKTFPQRF